MIHTYLIMKENQNMKKIAFACEENKGLDLK